MQKASYNLEKIGQTTTGDLMGKLILFLVALLCIGTLALVGYAYLGPMLGADFAPAPAEIRVPLTLSPVDG